MSQIDVRSKMGPGIQPRANGLSSGQRTANTVLGWALVATTTVSALAFGSVHGFTWGLLATGIGLATLIYSAVLLRRGEGLRVPLSRVRLPATLFMLFCVCLILQVLPFGLVAPPIVIAGDATASVESLALSVTADATWLMLLRQVTYGLFFYLMLQVTLNDGRRRLLQRALLLVLVGYGLLALISLQLGDSILGVPKTAYLGAATGSFVNRNSFATFMAMGAMIALAQGCRQIVNQIERHPHDGPVPGAMSATILFGIAYLLLMTVVVATQSRMGLLVACLGSAIVVTAAAFVTLSTRRALAVVGLAAVGLLIALLLFGGAAVDRAITTDSTVEVRADLYAQVVDLIMLRPLTGFGGGSFELAYPLVHREPVGLNLAWDKAHSTYLTLWSEMGLIAGSLPILIYGWAAVRLTIALSRRTSDWSVQATALAALLLSAVHSLVDFSLEIPANTFLLLALVASGLATTLRTPSR